MKALESTVAVVLSPQALVKPLQEKKAWEPMEVRLDGKVTLVKPRQERKAEEPMVRVPSGMVACPSTKLSPAMLLPHALLHGWGMRASMRPRRKIFRMPCSPPARTFS